MSKRLAVWLFAALLLMVGCSGKRVVLPGVTVQEGKDGSVTIGTKDGSLEVAGGQKGGNLKVPEGFPHKLMDGGKLDSSLRATVDGTTTYTLTVTYAKQEPRKVADYYEAELKRLGVEVNRSESEDSEGLTVMLIGSTERLDGWVSVSTNKETKGTDLVLIYSMK